MTKGEISKIDNYSGISGQPIFEVTKESLELSSEEQALLSSTESNMMLKPSFKRSLKDYVVKTVVKERMFSKCQKEYHEKELKRLYGKLRHKEDLLAKGSQFLDESFEL